MWKTTLLLITGAVLSGCDKPSEHEIARKRAERILRTNAEVSKPLAPQVRQVGANQVVILEIPMTDGLGSVDTQRCFVWRDMELKTASISCPHPPELSTAN